MDPVALAVPQPPVKRILYSKGPAAVGVPEMVITLADQAAVTPLGKPEPVVSIPVAPVVAIVIGAVKAVFTSSVGVDDGAAAVLLVTQVTVIVPVALAVPQPPVKRILYSKVPAAVGVPEIVISLADHVAVTPGGKPSVIWAIPVAPVVAIVIGVKAVFTRRVGLEAAAAVLVMMQPHESPVEDIMSDCPVVPGAKLIHLLPFQYKISLTLLPEGKSDLFNFVSIAAL
jgi:hypothetical protein